MLLNAEKSKKERIAEELFLEIKKGYDSAVSGNTKTLEEVFGKYGLSD